MVYLTTNDIINVNEQKQIMVLDNNSSENILIIGSCRITPILNYLINHDLFGNKYNYLCVLVYLPEMVQLSDDIIYNDDIKLQISQSKILFAEYCRNYNYFNTQRLTEKSIFRIHNSFTHEIILPNWSDICLYARDLIYYKDLKNNFYQLLKNEISFQEFTAVLQFHQEKELERHFAILNRANFPELITFTSMNLKTLRLANTLNHPTNIYNIELFRLIIEKFFEQSPYFLPQSVIDINTNEFLGNISMDTKLTFYDRVCLGINIDTNYLSEEESKNYIINELNK
jgi:hypothetical protein